MEVPSLKTSLKRLFPRWPKVFTIRGKTADLVRNQVYIILAWNWNGTPKMKERIQRKTKAVTRPNCNVHHLGLWIPTVTPSHHVEVLQAKTHRGRQFREKRLPFQPRSHERHHTDNSLLFCVFCVNVDGDKHTQGSYFIIHHIHKLH